MHWNRGTRNPVGPSHRVIKLASWLVCATVAIGLAPAGRANTVVFATGAQTPLGVAVDASATFDINTNSITVTLLNLTLNPTDVNQAIGSLRFTINGTTGTLTPTIASNSGTTFGVASGKTIISPTAESGTTWTTTPSSGQQVVLCVVCATFVTGTPGLILGGPSEPSDKYAAANPSLRTGTSGQWIIGTNQTYTGAQSFATFDVTPSWVINFTAGIDPNTVVITNVIFGFGKTAGYGTEFVTVEQETPEPGSVILFGIGLGLLVIAAGARRLRRR